MKRKIWKYRKIITFKLLKHCYKYKLTKSGSGVFLASHMLEQDLNSGIEYLQEQELKQNKCKKNYAGTSIENNSILVPA